MQLGMDGSSRQVGNHALNSGRRSKADLAATTASGAEFHPYWQRLAGGIVQTQYLARWPQSQPVPTQMRLPISTLTGSFAHKINARRHNLVSVIVEGELGAKMTTI
jgi:hypothetical protein